MPPGKRKSPFIGRKEPDDNPILYPRYNDISEIVLAPANNKGSIQPEQTVPPPAKKAKKENKPKVVDSGSHGQDEVAQQDDPRPIEEPQAASEAEDKLPESEGGGHKEIPNAASDSRKKKKKKKKGKASASGPGNAEEAQAMRGVLGYSKEASKDTNFGFNFSAEAAGASQKDQEPAALPAVAEEANDEPAVPSSAPQDGPDHTGVVANGTQASSAEDITDSKVRRIMGLEPLYVPRRIFVGGMPFDFEEDDVREYWSYCGEIEDIDLMRFPDTGRFKGIAFITFVEEAGAKEALKYNEEAIGDRKLKVEKCVADTKKENKSGLKAQRQPKAPAPKTEGYNVAYVGNVAFDASKDQLKEVFQDCRVAFVRLHTDKVTGNSKGFAHVHFEDEESLDRAMEFNGVELLGRRLRVGYAQPKKT